MTWEDTTHNRIRIVYSIKWYFLLYVLSSHIYIYMLDKWSYRTCFYLLRKVSVRQSHHPTWYDFRMGSNHLIGWSTFIQWCEATLGFEMEREKKNQIRDGLTSLDESELPDEVMAIHSTITLCRMVQSFHQNFSHVWVSFF